MSRLRNLVHDSTAFSRIQFEKQRYLHKVAFKHFANGLGTFRSIESNEPRSVELAFKLQNFGITSFLDIGSSFGVWTLPFMKFSQVKGREVRVLAIDAHPLSCHDLYKNAELNGLAGKNLAIINTAVGINNGYTTLHFPKYASNLGSTGEKNDTHRIFNQKIAIPVVEIDLFIKSFEPHLVKIDVEGMDLVIAKRIVESSAELKVLSVEITPTNLLNGGLDALQSIEQQFPFMIPIPKEFENTDDYCKILTLNEVVENANKTRKTNLFLFRNQKLAIQALSILNHES